MSGTWSNTFGPGSSSMGSGVRPGSKPPPKTPTNVVSADPTGGRVAGYGFVNGRYVDLGSGSGSTGGGGGGGSTRTTTTSGGSSGGRSYGGSGGGGGMSQANIDKLAQLFAQTRPDALKFDPYKSKAYQAPEFYDFSTQPYDMARTGLTDALAADRASGMAAYGDARTELDQYQNPYWNSSVTANPQIGEAMQRMMRANQGAGQQAANQTWNEGGAADQAMLRTFGMLGANDQARQASEYRALAGDQRRFNEGLDAEGRGLGLGIDMALAQARSQYDKDKWLYGTQVARQLYEDREAKALMNWQRNNEVSDANITNNNSWMTGILPAVTQLASQRPQGDLDALLEIFGGV